MEIKISTFTDETGQDTKWKQFYVCTVICLSKDQQAIETKLEEIEKTSKKTNKWFKSNNTRRRKYVSEILYWNLTKDLKMYYSAYQNKSDYIDLVASHLVKAIKTYSSNAQPEAKIFIDRVDQKTILGIKKEIKLFKIKFKKIRGLKDESSSIIRLSDTICGLIRDMGNKKVPSCYRTLFGKIQKL